MKSKVVTREEALSRIHDGQTIMFGDWHGEFAADEIIDGMLEKGIKDIDAIAVSAGMADQGVGKLIKDHRVKSLITTHIGLNPIAKDQMFAGELAIEFSPQGTFAERIRCGGAGLGGCLTPTGLGTEVEEGKQKLTIDGKEYLLELPLRADVALIKATKADTAANISFRMNSRATNSTMAMAADTVIVEVEEIVEVGELGPEEIDVPAPVIAGDTSDTDDYVMKLKKLAGNNPNIIFTGFVSGRTLEELYSNAYVYVLPSKLEGMPLSLLEAMSYGNCVIGSDIAEIADVVEDKAILFKKANVEDLKEKLQMVCDDVELVEKYKSEASGYICGRYNWEDVVNRTVEVYRGKKSCKEKLVENSSVASI